MGRVNCANAQPPSRRLSTACVCQSESRGAPQTWQLCLASASTSVACTCCCCSWPDAHAAQPAHCEWVQCDAMSSGNLSNWFWHQAMHLPPSSASGATAPSDMGEGEGASMDEFTPEELADDYGLPLETIVEFLLDNGVEAKRLAVNAPVKGVCTQLQLSELLAFLGSSDPIAAREVLCESTLSELADATLLSADELLALCKREDIRTVLGADTRIKDDEQSVLLDAIERAVDAPARWLRYAVTGVDDGDEKQNARFRGLVVLGG